MKIRVVDVPPNQDGSHPGVMTIETDLDTEVKRFYIVITNPGHAEGGTVKLVGGYDTGKLAECLGIPLPMSGELPILAFGPAFVYMEGFTWAYAIRDLIRNS